MELIPWNPHDTDSPRYCAVQRAEEALNKLRPTLQESETRLRCADELMQILALRYHVHEFSLIWARNLLTAFEDGLAKEWDRNTSAENVVSGLTCFTCPVSTWRVELC